MKKITTKDKERILSAADGRLFDVISKNVKLGKRGASFHGVCPLCQKDFEFNPSKSIFKCFHCDFGGNSPVSWYTKQGKTYPEALQLLADDFNIHLDVETLRATSPNKKNATADTPIPTRPVGKDKSFCSRMLAESGLTYDDVQAKIFRYDDNHTTTVGRVFRPGTLNSLNQIIDGDDAIIEYYDLEGAPVMYEQILRGKATGKMKEYFRVRWQFPEEHLDKNGKAFKYKSPTGSGSFIYIPQRIRELYKSEQKIPRLFIQEGEKKAEKACKHGIPSVAISGIHNLGRNGRLHEDLVRLIAACEVKELVLLFDSDWNDISSNIGLNDFADQRPRSFFTAAKNFKEYAIQLRNSRSIYLEIFIGNVLPGEDKGVDDLLSNTLRGNEDALKNDIDYLINERDLKGEYIQLHKITTISDAKLLELWSLQSANDFALRHKAILKELPEFRIGKYRWRFNEKGEIESAQPIEEDEKYWQETVKEDRHGFARTEYNFRYERCFRFLQNRGFFRYLREDGSYEYIRVEHPFITTLERHEDIRDFIKDFTREIANEEVLEMLHRGGPQFLGPEKLSNLQYYKPGLEDPRRDKQLFYFKNKFWEITADNIAEQEYSHITHQLWVNQKHNMDAVRSERLVKVKSLGEGKFDYKLSDAGRACHFLQFLINTSNFTWRKEKRDLPVVSSLDGVNASDVITVDELEENKGHLVSKLCAIGYMLMSAKDRNVSRAVVAMDGKQSEVGSSNGRSGKSLIGEMFRQVLPSVYINGKVKDLDSDQFLWNDVDIKTKIVFIDDVRTNFNFEYLFANITGDWSVNYKGGGRATFPFNKSPKIYLTTNHALNGEGSSFRDRQWKIAFSDFYNDNHKPLDDFGMLFFDEWDFEQWNLLWNLLAECVQLYLTFGVVQAPMERIAQREIRQFISETFLLWADEYFSDITKLNVQIPRKEISDNFFDANPEQKKYTTQTAFKKKLKKYCEYKGYIFNKHLFDEITGLPLKYDKDGNPIVDDKSGGTEYFYIGTDEKIIEEQKPF